MRRFLLSLLSLSLMFACGAPDEGVETSNELAEEQSQSLESAKVYQFRLFGMKARSERDGSLSKLYVEGWSQPVNFVKQADGKYSTSSLPNQSFGTIRALAKALVATLGVKVNGHEVFAADASDANGPYIALSIDGGAQLRVVETSNGRFLTLAYPHQTFGSVLALAERLLRDSP